MNKLLTKRQKAVLAQLAARAYSQLEAFGCTLPPFTEWRHDETGMATGSIDSFTRLTQQDFVTVYNHFALYAGTKQMRDTTWTPQEKALYSLRDALQRYEFSPDYLASIVRDQLHLHCTGKTVLLTLRNNASVEVVRHLTFTIINRGRAQARKMTLETGLQTYEPHSSPNTLPPGKLARHFNAVCHH